MSIEVGLSLSLALSWAVAAYMIGKALHVLHTPDYISRIFVGVCIVATVSWGIITVALQTILTEPSDVREFTIRLSLLTKLAVPIGLAFGFYKIGQYIHRY